MRLLYVVSSVDPAAGGVAEAVRSLGLAQRDQGHEIAVATLDAPTAPYLSNFPLPLHPLGPGRGGYGYRRDFPARLRALASSFDAVILNGLWQYTTLGSWLALRRTSIPYYLFPHGMLDPWFKRAYPLKHLKKWFYWTLLEHRVLRDARAVLFTAEDERLLARQAFWLYRCREEVTGLGCPPPPLERERQIAAFLEAHPQLRNRRLLLFLGRLHDKKGCDLLIQAFGQRHDTTLVMAGPPADAGYLKHLQTLAAKHCLPGSVHFPGMLTGDLKWGAFQAAETFVLPSHQENFGLAVAEALACGLPVLISRKINIWREIEAARAGLTETDDLAGTGRLLQRWEATSPEERQAMTRAARDCFESHFEVSTAARRLAEVICKTTARKP